MYLYLIKNIFKLDSLNYYIVVLSRLIVSRKFFRRVSKIWGEEVYFVIIIIIKKLNELFKIQRQKKNR